MTPTRRRDWKCRKSYGRIHQRPINLEKGHAKAEQASDEAIKAANLMLKGDMDKVETLKKQNDLDHTELQVFEDGEWVNSGLVANNASKASKNASDDLKKSSHCFCSVFATQVLSLTSWNLSMADCPQSCQEE